MIFDIYCGPMAFYYENKILSLSLSLSKSAAAPVVTCGAYTGNTFEVSITDVKYYHHILILIYKKKHFIYTHILHLAL